MKKVSILALMAFSLFSYSMFADEPNDESKDNQESIAADTDSTETSEES